MDLWRAFQQSPSEASFQPLYEATQDLVWTLCRRILRDEADAEEAFQSTWCRLLALAREPEGAAEAPDAASLVSRLAIREVEFYTPAGNRRVSLPAIEVSGDREADSIEIDVLDGE
jgi:hypothetical protein